MRALIGILPLLLLLVSCKSGQLKTTKDADDSIKVTDTRLNKRLNAADILDNHLSVESDFETLHMIGDEPYSGFSMSVQTDIRIDRSKQILIIIKILRFTGANV